MMKTILIGSFLLALATQVSGAGLKLPTVKQLKELKVSPTELLRQAVLAESKRFNYVFDFKNATVGVSEGKGGTVVSANARNFPALVNSGVSMIVGYIKPCGLIVPHIHSRSTSMIYVAEGELLTGFYQEAGAKYVTNVVRAGQATVFPQGSIHFEQNTGCEPATLIAALNNEDPGFTPATIFYQTLPEDIVSAALGGASADAIRDQAAALPAIPSHGVKSCLQKCGIEE